MTTPRKTTLSRWSQRLPVLLPAVAVTVLTAPANAAVPDQWEAPPPVSPLDFLLVLVIIPGALFAVIFLLASLGSMVRSHTSYQPGLAWRSEPEWFGGPRGGLEKVDQQSQTEVSATEQGGASGRW